MPDITSHLDQMQIWNSDITVTKAMDDFLTIHILFIFGCIIKQIIPIQPNTKVHYSVQP